MVLIPQPDLTKFNNQVYIEWAANINKNSIGNHTSWDVEYGYSWQYIIINYGVLWHQKPLEPQEWEDSNCIQIDLVQMYYNKAKTIQPNQYYVFNCKFVALELTLDNYYMYFCWKLKITHTNWEVMKINTKTSKDNLFSPLSIVNTCITCMYIPWIYTHSSLWRLFLLCL